MAEGLYIYHEGHEQEHQQVMRELKEAADMIVNVNSRMKALHDGLKGAGFAGQAQGMREWANLAREATRSMGELTEALKRNAEAAKGAGKGVGGWIKEAAEAAEAGKTLTGVLGGIGTWLYRAGGSIKTFSGLTAGLGTVISRLGVGIRAISMATGGWGIVIQGVITGLALFGDRIFGTKKKVEDFTKTNNDFAESLDRIERETMASAHKEVARLQLLQGVIDSETASRKKKLEVAGEMQSLYPDILGNYGREEIAAGKARDAVNGLTEALLKKAAADAAGDKYGLAYVKVKEIEGRKNKIQKEFDEEQSKLNALESKLSFPKAKTLPRSELGAEVGGQRIRVAYAGKQLRDLMPELEAAQADLNKYKDIADQALKEVPVLLTKVKTNNSNTYRNRDSDNGAKKAQHQPLPKLNMIEPNLEEDLKSLNEEYARLHETKAKLSPQQQKILDLQQVEAQRMVWLEDSYRNGLITLEEYNRQKQEIGLNATANVLEAQAEEIQGQLELNTSQEERVALLTKLKGIFLDINSIKKQNDEEEVKTEKAKQQRLKDNIELVKKLGATTKEVYAEVMEIVRRRNEAANKAADEDFEKIKRNNEYEVEKIQASQMTAEQKAEAIAKIQAQEEAQAQAIDQQKRQRAQKMAVAEKSFNVSEIIGRTALAVITALTDNEIPYYLRVINAVAAGVTGSAQLANALSAPLPQYAAGTEHAPEGYAIVGERGAEGRIDPDGSFSLTPGRASLTYLQEGTRIIPHEETKALVAMSSGIGMSAASVALMNKQSQLNFEKSIGAHGEKVVGALGKVEKALKKKTRQQNLQHKAFIENHFKQW